MYKKSKARVELDKDREFILWLFDSKCVKCGRPTNIIHEIVPISHGKGALHWTNRVPVCMVCHDWAHSVGTRTSIPILQDIRRKFIVRKFDLIDTDTVSENEQNISEESKNSEGLSG